MGDRTQHEGKTERAKESHDRCSQPPGMRMPKTADLGTQALLVVKSFKLHLNNFICSLTTIHSHRHPLSMTSNSNSSNAISNYEEQRKDVTQ